VNIVEIKIRNDRHKELQGSGDIHAAFEMKHILDVVPNDIQYLLSIIEQVTEGLEQIKYDFEQTKDANKACTLMYNEAKTALQAIMGNDNE
jgi:hypothetical protein